MIFDDILKNRKIVYLLLLLGLLNALLIAQFFGGHFYRGDTPTYIESARWLAGDKTAEVQPYRLLKPLGLLLPALFEKLGFLGEYGLQFQNLIFYFISIILFFDLAAALSGSKVQGIFAVLLFITAWPFLTNALSFLTDMAGWFFYLLPVWFLVKLAKKQKLNLKFSFWLGVITGSGFLFKESAVAFLFFLLGYLIFVSQEKLSQRAAFFVTSLLGFGLPVLLSSFLVYCSTGYTFFDWYQKSMAKLPAYTLINIFLNGIIVFLLGWLFFFFGVFAEWKERNKERINWLLSFILPSFSGFAWCVPDARILFVAFPLLALLGSRGLCFIESKKGKVLSLVLLLGYVFLNYFAPRVVSLSQIRAFFNL